MIKNKQDLEKIKESLAPLMKMREGKKRLKIVVALGEENPEAQATLMALIEGLHARKIDDCAVLFGPKSPFSPTPVVEIHGQYVSTTYLHVTADVVPDLIESHIVNGKILESHVYKGEK